MKTKLIYTLFIFCCFSFIGTNIYAQDESERLMYSYDTFKEGYIYYKNEKPTKAQLNYNFVLQEMQFVLDGVIYNLKQSKDITYIEIGTDVFVPVNKVYALVLVDGEVTLLNLKKMTTSSEEKMGAYGTPTNTSAVENPSTINVAGTPLHNLVYHVESSQKFDTNETLYFMKDNKSYVSSKRNLYKVFPSKKSEIDEYLSKNKINFKEKKDLIDLFNFLLK